MTTSKTPPELETTAVSDDIIAVAHCPVCGESKPKILDYISVRPLYATADARIQVHCVLSCGCQVSRDAWTLRFTARELPTWVAVDARGLQR